MRRRLLAIGLAVLAVLAGGAASATERDDGGDEAEVATGPSPVTPVLSARRVPGLLAAPVADRRLSVALDDVVARQGAASCLSVAAAGRVVYEHNDDLPLTPASVQKLLTAAAALEVLGEDHRFVTRVVAGAAPVDGVIAGDAWVVGSGDPLLSTAAYAARFRNQPQTVTPVEALADAVVAAGVARIDGRLLGDETRFDADRYPDDWAQRLVDQDQSGPLSALTVNDGWAAFPPRWDARVPDETPAPDPPAHAAAVVATVLGQRAVAVAGGTGSGPAPPGAVEIARVESPPLRDVVRQLLDESDNETGELLAKEIAVAAGRPGTTDDGAAVVAATLAELDLPTEGTTTLDGSGLAEGDTVTCDLVLGILDRSPEGTPIGDGLSIAGRTGTLSRRFVDAPVAGRLRAKTGSLNRVRSLAGQLTTVPGADLTFSFIVNLPPGQAFPPDGNGLQDELVAVLDRYPEGPALDELGPRPARVADG